MSQANGSIIQRYIPRLAETLGKLRRSPGRNEGWVEGIWQALEAEDPDTYDRTRRRIGFARRLAELADVDTEDQATATAGILFSELLQAAPPDARRTAAKAWTDYLVRNVDWLAPAFEVVTSLESGDWEDAGSDGAVLARIALLFDTETASRHLRPLQILQSLIEEAPSPAVERIAPALWSEYGQELCDQHFRRPDSYRIEAEDIRRSLDVLKGVQPKPLVKTTQTEQAVAPMQWSGRKTPRPQQPKATRPSVARRASAADNFERRRQALRSSISGPDRPSDTDHDEPVWKHEEEGAMASRNSPEVEPNPHGDVDVHETDLELAASVLRRRKIPEPAAQQEEMMSPNRDIAYSRPEREASSGAASSGDHLAELRAQLQQIQRAAAAGERLLTEIGPQLEDLATWVADIEAVIGRRRRSGADRVA